MRKAALAHGFIDHIHSAVHIAFLIGVFNAENEFPVVFPCNQIGIKRSAQVADMHISGWTGRKSSAHLSSGDAGLHLVEPGFVFHSIPPKK